MIEIRNAKGSSKWISVTGAWQKDFYYYHAQKHDAPYQANKVKYRCLANGCWGNDIVGAHIRFPNKEKRGIHIIPLCRSCNSKGPDHEMKISGFTKLMPANRIKFADVVKTKQNEIEGRYKKAQKAIRDLSPKKS